MPRSTAIGKLAAGIQDAAVVSDWERLGALASALAPQLSALRERGDWTGSELAALAQLRAVHDGAAAACGQALDTLALRLADMRNNKDGWMAYALASDPEPAGHQE
jgi:hypothetical protein